MHAPDVQSHEVGPDGLTDRERDALRDHVVPGILAWFAGHPDEVECLIEPVDFAEHVDPAGRSPHQIRRAIQRALNRALWALRTYRAYILPIPSRRGTCPTCGAYRILSAIGAPCWKCQGAARKAVREAATAAWVQGGAPLAEAAARLRRRRVAS